MEELRLGQLAGLDQKVSDLTKIRRDKVEWKKFKPVYNEQTIFRVANESSQNALDAGDSVRTWENSEVPKEEIQILRGVPIPERTERYPFDKLAVNDCFLVGCDDMKHERSIRSCATRWNKNEDGRRYVVRRMPYSQNTVGVWRVS